MSDSRHSQPPGLAYVEMDGCYDFYGSFFFQKHVAICSAKAIARAEFRCFAKVEELGHGCMGQTNELFINYLNAQFSCFSTMKHNYDRHLNLGLPMFKFNPKSFLCRKHHPIPDA